MGVSLARTYRPFAGMIYPDAAPITVDAEHVRAARAGEVPTLLREHARETLHTLAGDEWWTLGEFRYLGEYDYDTAVARRVTREGHSSIEYGIELDV